jgi:hypothetical protein
MSFGDGVLGVRHHGNNGATPAWHTRLQCSWPVLAIVVSMSRNILSISSSLREPYDRPRCLIAIGEDRRMQKLLEVVEIWFVLNLATFAFIMWYRRSPSYRRRH